ncbi:ZP domain-containing protein-like isoform X3 [Oculina patagonica]
MKQILCLSIAAVLLFGASVVHGQASATLVNIDCASVTAISFDIDIPDIAQWDTAEPTDVNAWALNAKTDASCKPSFNQGTGNVEYAPFSVVTCADAPEVTSTQVIYSFNINVAAVADPTASPVTYQYDHQYTVRCFYDRENSNLQASFEPLHLLTSADGGNGQLLFAFTLHLQSDGSLLSGVIDLSTPIYGQVLVQNDANFPNLDVHLTSVTASSDAANSAGQVTLITNGCEDANGIVDADSLTCDTNADERFDMNAFRYPGQTTGNLVYFHATAIVCLSTNAGSTCQTQCAAACPPAKRKRRETVQDVLQTTYYVKAGPYRIVDPNEAPEAAVDKDEGAAFPSYVIAIVAVCGVAAIAIVSATVLIVLRRKRPLNATVAEPRDAEATA